MWGFEPLINPPSGTSRSIFLPTSDEFPLCLWNLSMLKKSIFSTRVMSILPCLCPLHACAPSIATAAEEQGHCLSPTKNCMTSVRMQTAFAENAAEPSDELSLDFTGQPPHKAYSSHNTYCIVLDTLCILMPGN